MKKLFLISTILLWLLLTWCSQNKLSQDELFEKKQGCNTYKNIIEKELEKDNENILGSIYLKEIFYSPSRNSCIYIKSIDYYLNNYNFVWETAYDILTNETIWYWDSKISEDTIIQDLDQEKEYFELIKELKWE